MKMLIAKGTLFCCLQLITSVGCFFSVNQIKEDEMGGTYITHGKDGST
jgi:hypothetical protein